MERTNLDAVIEMIKTLDRAEWETIAWDLFTMRNGIGGTGPTYHVEMRNIIGMVVGTAIATSGAAAISDARATLYGFGTPVTDGLVTRVAALIIGLPSRTGMWGYDAVQASWPIAVPWPPLPRWRPDIVGSPSPSHPPHGTGHHINNGGFGSDPFDCFP